jgi:phage/plasmid-like protein (TIGR03299 family)
MPAEIFGNRVAVHRVPAWHRIGIVFEEPLSTVEAIKMAGLDYRVDLFPMFYQYEDSLLDSGQKAIVREPTSDDPNARFFGSVSDRYHIVQNLEIAEALKELSNVWPVESAGALGRGESFFLSFSAGGAKVANEDIENYFLVVDDKTGARTLRLLFTPVRVVCQNTLTAAMAQAIQIGLRHTSSITLELEDYAALMQRATDTQSDVIGIFNQMARAEVSEEQALTIIKAAYPMPKLPTKVRPYVAIGNDGDYLLSDQALATMPEAVRNAAQAWQLARERTKLDRGTAYQLFDKISDENGEIGNTAWAAWNAVTEYEDHIRSRTGPAGGLSEVLGDRANAKMRAFKEAVGVLG